MVVTKGSLVGRFWRVRWLLVLAVVVVDIKTGSSSWAFRKKKGKKRSVSGKNVALLEHSNDGEVIQGAIARSYHRGKARRACVLLAREW
eukprot:g32623.t1